MHERFQKLCWKCVMNTLRWQCHKKSISIVDRPINCLKAHRQTCMWLRAHNWPTLTSTDQHWPCNVWWRTLPSVLLWHDRQLLSSFPPCLKHTKKHQINTQQNTWWHHLMTSECFTRCACLLLSISKAALASNFQEDSPKKIVLGWQLYASRQSDATNFSDRALSAAGPQVWNYLPTDLR